MINELPVYQTNVTYTKNLDKSYESIFQNLSIYTFYDIIALIIYVYDKKWIL